MTDEQAQWAEAMKSSMQTKPSWRPIPPKWLSRRVVFHLVMSKPFDLFITAVIICNIFAMACDYWGIEQDLEVFKMYNDAMMSFGNVYYCECVLKLLGLGFLVGGAESLPWPPQGQQAGGSVQRPKKKGKGAPKKLRGPLWR